MGKKTLHNPLNLSLENDRLDGILRLFDPDVAGSLDCPDCLEAEYGLCVECEHSERILDSEFKHGS